MKTSKKIALAAALMSILGVGAVIKTVSASPSQNSVQVAQASDGDGEANDATEAPEIMKNGVHHTKIAQASDGDGETNDDQEEQQEDKKLQALAKITAEQAKQAAETSVGDKASSVKLENEDGNLVYAVKIGQKEVKVDAGNGKVLYTENANQESDENEASRPKSSIQVTENNNEGETNEGSK
ncbi:peptidase [Fischerella thermalis CCMEE 5330]|uniref:Peptidase n=1 Tax=Fischerella thermalis CCMEE 5330 TaxID=2019670 RepID=A0A2N6MH78_9CYAN|nr:PepSY domain-containing protein [Fischerella thermalis]PMB46119.1 peptidase [Fischerella thermalis CCMEE 5330]